MFTLYLYDDRHSVNICMDLNAFAHGQIHSKIWLCEQLEPLLNPNDKIAILGSWYNILAFMLNIRKPKFYQHITGFDLDSVQEEADKITCSWIHLPELTVFNRQADVNQIDLSEFNVIISTSVEHITENIWFNNIKENTLICLQSSTLGTEIEYFKVSNPNTSLDQFKQKYPLSKIVYEGFLDFDYPVNPYKRLMTIGYK